MVWDRAIAVVTGIKGRHADQNKELHVDLHNRYGR